MDYQMVTWSKDQSLRLWAPYQETQYRCGVDEEELDSESLSGESDEEACDALDQATEAFEEEGQAETEAVKKRVEFADICILEGRKGEKRLESPVKEHSSESTVENTLQQEFALLDTSNFNFLNVTELDLSNHIFLPSFEEKNRLSHWETIQRHNNHQSTIDSILREIVEDPSQ